MQEMINLASKYDSNERKSDENSDFEGYFWYLKHAKFAEAKMRQSKVT